MASFPLPPQALSKVTCFTAALIVSILGLASRAHAQENNPAGQMVSRNEATKTELFYYVEYKPVAAGQQAEVKAKSFAPYPTPGFRDVPWASGTASSAGQWLLSGASKIENEIAINRVYRLQPLTTTNVERYRFLLKPSNGYETYYRVAGTNAAFQPGSVLEETPGGAGFEIVVMPVEQAGALPGKSTALSPMDGSFSFALGFLANGRSAGFLDFLPKVDYRVEGGATDISVSFGRALSAADFNCVRLNEELEVVTINVPDFASDGIPATSGIRQVIAPQTVVDVSRDGFDLLVKFYHPSQKASRILSEANPYGGASVAYASNAGPYTFTGTPIVTYRINWVNGVTLQSNVTSTHGNGNSIGGTPLPTTTVTTKTSKVYSNLTVTRTEGADTKVATLVQEEIVVFKSDHTLWVEDVSTCGTCDGMGEYWGDVDCNNCYAGLYECNSCGGAGEIGTTLCGSCNGEGVLECEFCYGEGTVSGWETCPGECGGTGSITDIYDEYVPAGIEYGSAAPRSWVVNGFGAHTRNTTTTGPANLFTGGHTLTEQEKKAYHSFVSVFSSAGGSAPVTSSSTSIYEGGFPAFRCEFLDNIKGKLTTYDVSEGTQKIKALTDGSLGLVSLFSYYRLAATDPRYESHHGRLKWRKGDDGEWEMLEYSTDPSSLGSVTRVVRSYLDTSIPGWPTNNSTGQGWQINSTSAFISGPNLDTAMPATIPQGESIAGMRVTTTTYTGDWEGIKRLPSEVIETADNQRVGHTKYTYSTATANSEPLWITETWSYPNSSTDNNNSAANYSIGKIYKGRLPNGTPVSAWLDGLPYASQGADGSKETVAYHRGNYNAPSKTFVKSSSGLGLRSIVFKGRASSSSGGTALSSYDGATIDTIYLIPNVSTAEVTIRDDRAFTVRSETLVFTGGSWTLIDSADMQYDNAGNLTRREKINGALYEATYVDSHKISEKDEQGLTTTFHYDSEGRVSHTIREAFGSVPALRTSFTYDADNRILSTVIGNPNAEQIVSATTYDSSGRVLTETNQGLTTTYAYTVENGILTKTTITLPGGATQILENYRDGRPKSVTGTAGIAEYYHYSVESGQETATKYLGSDGSARWTKSFTDWAGRTVRTESSSTGGTLVSTSAYNSLGQLTTTQADTLAATTYTYDGNGVMNQYTQADRKNSFSYGYRTDGNVWSRYGGDTSTLWDYSETKAYPAGVPAGQIQTRTWTRVTNFNRVSGPPGITGIAIAESVAADANDNRAVTQTFLDRPAAKVTTVVWSPFAAQPSISVAVAGRLISQTSSAGITVTYGYDALGRATSTTDRTGTSTVAYESGKTRLQSVTDARGVTQHTYSYDNAGRLSQDQTPRIVAGAQSGTNSSFFAYNTRGQLTHIWGDVPYPVKYDYDSYGDRTGQTTYRDGTNWSASTLAASGWPGSGDTTTFGYFASNGLLNTKTDPANKTVTYTYNKRGQLATRQWARGTTTTYAYNDSTTGDLSSATYSDGTPALSYAYDQLGRTQTVQDATGTRNFAYRTADLKPASETFRWPGLSATRQLTNQYDPTTGRLIGFSLDNGGTSEHALSYGFDPVNGRLKTITSGAGVFQYSYLANSNLISSVTRGSYAQSRTYEANRNVLTNLSTSTQTGTIAAYTYASDDIGRRTTVDQSGAVYDPYTLGTQLLRTAYGYNNRNEVTSAGTSVAGTPLPARSFGYAFDPIGNRTQDSLDGTVSSYAANNLNQYTSRGTPGFIPVTGTANKTGGAGLTIDGSAVTNWTNNYFYHGVSKNGATTPFYQSFAFNASSGGASQAETVRTAIRPVNEAFTYDDDGNLLSDSLWVYRYDGENRLISMHARVANSGQQPIAVRFAHDYMGRRVSKEVLTFTGTPEVPTGYTPQSKTLFVYQGWTLLAEYDVSLNLQRRFTFGIDLSGSLGGAGDIGGLLAIEDLRSTPVRGTYLSAFDGNGNLMALTDGATGGLAAAYEYDPFGNALRATGSYGKENPFRFAGKYFDQETGLSFYGFRYYNASTGRFVNRDPLEERGGWNLYSGLRFGTANPFAGTTGTEGTSWSTNWEQVQSRLLSNTSLPHTTQAVTFGSKKNSGLPGASGSDQKTYAANATAHYAQGGAPGTGPQAPSMSGSNPGAGNADINLYAYAGNNPITAFDAMGLNAFTDWCDDKWSNAKYNSAAIGTGIVDFAVGTAGGWTEANSPVDLNIQPHSFWNDVGVRTGHLVALVQGVLEIGGGTIGATGGAIVEGGTLGVASPVALPVIAGSAVVAIHGGAVTKNSWDLIKSDMSRGPVSNSSTSANSSSPSQPSVKKSGYNNPGHHDPQKPNYDPERSVLPANHEELWKSSVPGLGDKHRWAKEGTGKNSQYHIFRNDGNGTFHWSGSTNGKTKSGKPRTLDQSLLSKIPRYLRRQE